MITILTLLSLSPAIAAKPMPALPRAAAPEKRATRLSFEDGVIESLKRPGVDSLDMSGSEGVAIDSILYMKRKDFRAEIRQTLDELRFNP